MTTDESSIQKPVSLKIGIISDTHDRLYPDVARFLADCDEIISAGDLDTLKLLNRLKSIAPVTAARGNCDWGPWASALPRAAATEIGGKRFYIIHRSYDLDIVPETSGFDAVIFGHTHIPTMFSKNGVTYLNPGSASEPRGGSSRSAALAIISGEFINFELHNF
ncbi:MAG: metallophosphatase family protein [bacterium]|nr:metallophosphatase family protein [bacterium]